jgi:hypothetical protein
MGMDRILGDSQLHEKQACASIPASLPTLAGCMLQFQSVLTKSPEFNQPLTQNCDVP